MNSSALRYTPVAILLHWIIAAFILFNLSLGRCMRIWRHGNARPPTVMPGTPPEPDLQFNIGENMEGGIS